MHISDFAMSQGEQRILKYLVRKAKPLRVAEFGSGGSTAVLAQASSARVISWDNMPEWIEAVKGAIEKEAWSDRVEIRAYAVTPEGNRDVEKDPVPYDGPDFDLVFIDGPRSAHPSSYGRDGSFLFAVKHTRPGGIIAWHDNDRTHERERADQYLGGFTIHDWGRIGWCRKVPSGPMGRMMARIGSLWVRHVYFRFVRG